MQQGSEGGDFTEISPPGQGLFLSKNNSLRALMPGPRARAGSLDRAPWLALACAGTVYFFLPMQQIRAAVTAEFEQVNQLIVDQLHSDVDMVENIGHYIVDAGGKRRGR